MAHPAPYSKELMMCLDEILKDSHVVLDPMAGVGRIHQLRTEDRKTIGIEIEKEWADEHEGTIHGSLFDWRELIVECPVIDAICVSPVFGNRLSDHHNAKDGSHRRTYKHYLGREPTEGSSAVMQWGWEYKRFHVKAWTECYEILAPGGLFVLNIKDHIRDGERQYVSGWHVRVLCDMFELLYHVEVNTPGYGYGANRELRCPEYIYVFRKEDT